MKILVTGQTGVGKSSLLVSHKHYSFDKQNNSVWIKKGSEYYNFILHNFGKDYVNDKEINKQALGKLLFTNSILLEKVNNFVVPIVRKWIKSLPDNSIIEFAQYIKNEKAYVDLFDKVILVINTLPNLNSKFNYLNKNYQPIKDNHISYDFLINNSHFKGQKEFDKIITMIFNI